MHTFELSRQTFVDAPLDEVFAFFSDAANLEQLTPPFLGFEILTPGPVDMGVGALIDYRIRLHGLPLRWRSEITAWDPPHRFVDEQRRGPYRLWVHEHRFEARHGGTLVSDRVRYAVLGGALADRLFVRRDLRRIFDYRAEQLERCFPSRGGPRDGSGAGPGPAAQAGPAEPRGFAGRPATPVGGMGQRPANPGQEIDTCRPTDTPRVTPQSSPSTATSTCSSASPSSRRPPG